MCIQAEFKVTQSELQCQHRQCMQIHPEWAAGMGTVNANKAHLQHIAGPTFAFGCYPPHTHVHTFRVFPLGFLALICISFTLQVLRRRLHAFNSLQGKITSGLCYFVSLQPQFILLKCLFDFSWPICHSLICNPVKILY